MRAGMIEAPLHGMDRQRRHMFDTGEPFLLGGRHHMAVPHQHRRRIPHIGQAQNKHARRINEVDGTGKFASKVAIPQGFRYGGASVYCAMRCPCVIG